MIAKNIIELSQELYFNKPVTKEEANYRVPLYDDIILDMRDKIMNERSKHKTFYIAGQSGTGKTTAMNFLPDEAMNENFETIYINYKDLINFDDADIIDVLLMFAYRLAETSTKIETKFHDELDQIYKTHHNKLEEIKDTKTAHKLEAGVQADAQISYNFLGLLKSKLGFFASYKMDKEVRKTTREFFFRKKSDLLNLVNTIITEWYDDKGDKKELLVIFDDFDKLRSENQIYTIFIENRMYLEGIECKKIFSIPMNLVTHAEFTRAGNIPYHFYLVLRENPIYKHSSSKDKELIKKNKALFISIIKKRYEGDLIEEAVFEEAIKYSGGLLRQYINLIHEAATRVRRFKGTKISLHDFEEARDTMRKGLSMTIIGDEIINLLAHVMKSHKPVQVDNKLFVKAILFMQIIVHPNNDAWYDVNPIIKETVKNYSEKSFDFNELK